METERKHCNVCGLELDIWDLQEELSIDKEKLGYGTAYDGDSVHLRFCCRCFDKLVESCKITPIIERW